jgi:hypothetical protein
MALSAKGGVKCTSANDADGSISMCWTKPDNFIYKKKEAIQLLNRLLYRELLIRNS